MTRAVGDPLGIAALAKQVPVTESLRLEDGRLVRVGAESEMNPYCRRAVAQGVLLARATGGTCTVVTLGPPAAEDVLREAVAWGADTGLHCCDDVFAGSDTLATARTLAAALQRVAPLDLVLVGRNSIDGETGQVGPELAELLGLPFAGGVRRLEDAGAVLRLHLEHDDGSQEVEVELPAVLSVAERLCDPCKAGPELRAAVPASRLVRIAAEALGPGPWGEAASPTVVGRTRPLEHARDRVVLSGTVEEQVDQALQALHRRKALVPAAPALGVAGPSGKPDGGVAGPTGKPDGGVAGPSAPPSSRVIAVVAEPGRPGVARELLGAAARLARDAGAAVHALCPHDDVLARGAADRVVMLQGTPRPEDVAQAVTDYVHETRPWAVLVPSTAFGREVAGRAAAATGSGLVGDAVELWVRDQTLVAAKPAFAGALVANVTCRSPVQMVTVRPGVLPDVHPAPRQSELVTRTLAGRGRVRVLSEQHDDDIETLARAQVVIGVGSAVAPDEYGALSPLTALLGAELAATRKVTDRGWAPRSRQVGITGRAIAPRLYVALGLSGKFNHMVAVRAAGTILAVNTEPDAPVFTHCDIGIVGDWREVVPLLAAALRQQGAPGTSTDAPDGATVG